MSRKSLITNLTAFLLVIAGFWLPENWGYLVFNVGLFALSGGLTNWLAVHMLFERVPLLYGSGVIPNHFDEFKSGIKNLMLEQFFTRQNIERLLDQEKAGQIDKIDLSALADEIDYDKLFDRLKETILATPLGGMLGLVGGEKVIETLRQEVVTVFAQATKEELENPRLKDTISRHIFDQDLTEDLIQKIEQVIEQRLAELTPQTVKEIISAMIRRHLGWLVVWGGVFGGFIGLLLAVLKIYQVVNF